MSTKNVISKNGVWKTAPLNDTPSSGGVLVVTATDGTLDKTWNDIYNAAENGIPSVLRVVEEDSIRFNWLSSVFKEGTEESTFYVDFGVENVDFAEYTSDSASGYPTVAM